MDFFRPKLCGQDTGDHLAPLNTGVSSATKLLGGDVSALEHVVAGLSLSYFGEGRTHRPTRYLSMVSAQRRLFGVSSACGRDMPHEQAWCQSASIAPPASGSAHHLMPSSA